MHVEPLQPVFARAAAPTLQRLRDDRQRAPRRVQPLLSFLEAHLFDTDLDYQQLKRSCGVRDNTMPALFHQAVGMPPATYMRDCRMSTAARLLSDSALKVWQISDLVGYSSLQVFGRAFKRWSGSSPVAYRRQHRKTGAAKTTGRREAPALELSPTAGRKVFRGGLDEAQATEILARLTALYPTQGRALIATAPSWATADGDGLPRPSAAEEASAETAWRALEALEPEARRRALRRDVDDDVVMPLFHLLCELSRTRGRDDREHGVEIADLALELLRRLPLETPPRQRRQLQALGWANLANARRLALDVVGARTAMDRAEHATPADAAPEVLGEVLMIKAALRWYEERLEEAIALAARSVELLVAARRVSDAARALNVKAIALLRLGRSEAAIGELHNAIQLLGRKDDLLRYTLYEALIRAALEMGDVAGAEAELPTARSAASRLQAPIYRAMSRWLEGSVAQAGGRADDALQLLGEARDQLEEIGADNYVAEISFDLAQLYVERQELDAAAEHAARGLPLFDALGRQAEARAAHALLSQALAERRIDAEVFRHLRPALERLRREPKLGLR